MSCNAQNQTKVTSSGSINPNAPYKWAKSDFPRTLRISENFNSDERKDITDMANAWEQPVGTNFFNTTLTKEVSSSTMNMDQIGQDNIDGIYRITHWPKDLSSRALAVTQIFGKRMNIGESSEYVRIYKADIFINENRYSFRTADDVGASDSYDLRTVVLHELGHFLGLGHKYGDTVMVPYISEDESIIAPTMTDIQDISSKYGIKLALNPKRSDSNEEENNQIDGNQLADEETSTPVKLIIELMADGECIHSENGVEIERHFPFEEKNHK